MTDHPDTLEGASHSMPASLPSRETAQSRDQTLQELSSSPRGPMCTSEAKRKSKTHSRLLISRDPLGYVRGAEGRRKAVSVKNLILCLCLCFTGHLVHDVREAVDHFRREMSENMKDAFTRSTDKLYHVITGNNRIVQFRIGENGKLILEKTIQSLNMQTNKIKEARQKLIDAGKQVPLKTKKQIREAITGDPNKRIRDHLKEEPQVKMIDKFSFTLGVLVITFTEWIIMRHPAWFQSYYQLLMTFLFVLRYVNYKEAKFQFFMLDFCYLVNFSCMIQTFFYPDHLVWFVANFAASMGPLASAIVVWRNSLVFHDLDKVTSFFLHAFPPLLCHLLRWDLIPCNAVQENTSISFGPYFFSAVGIYVCWQIMYLVATEYLFKPQLDADPELTTSLRYLSQDKKNPARKLVNKVCVQLKVLRKDEEMDPDQWKTKIIFVVSQLVYTIFTLIPPYLIFLNYSVSVIYLITIFSWATWNGASYYVEVFSKRYNMKFGQEIVSKDKVKAEHGNESSAELKRPPKSSDQPQDEDDDIFLDSLDHLNLNESQAIELIEILEKLEDDSDENKAANNGSGSSEDGSDIVKISKSDLDEKELEELAAQMPPEAKKDV